MRYIISEHFKKQLKGYLKKFRSLFEDVILSLENFSPFTSISLGRRTYKVRVKSSDLNKGKSHGFRLVVFVIKAEEYITPLVIYFKGERADMSKEEILHNLQQVQQELDLQ